MSLSWRFCFCVVPPLRLRAKVVVSLRGGCVAAFLTSVCERFRLRRDVARRARARPKRYVHPPRPFDFVVVARLFCTQLAARSLLDLCGCLFWPVRKARHVVQATVPPRDGLIKRIGAPKGNTTCYALFLRMHGVWCIYLYIKIPSFRCSPELSLSLL